MLLLLGVYFLLSYRVEPGLVSVVSQEEHTKNKGSEQKTEEKKEEKKGEHHKVMYQERNPERPICVGEYCDGHMNADTNYTKVKIPLISDGDLNKPNETIGCGSLIVWAPHIFEPKTPAVLDATYKVLFSLAPQSEIISDNVRNPVGLENKLHYAGLTSTNGIVTLKLRGQMYVAGSCMIPEFRAQIEQAALQYESVQELRVHLNDTLWDWCDYSMADPSEDGCDTNPKHWVVKK